MKRFVLLLSVVAMFVVAAQPASAATANRVVKTSCLYNPVVGINTIYTVKAIDDTRRHTTIPCYGYVPNLSKPQDSVGRPTTDLYGADESARRWWPRCAPTWYAADGPLAFGGNTWWFWYFTICTA